MKRILIAALLLITAPLMGGSAYAQNPDMPQAPPGNYSSGGGSAGGADPGAGSSGDLGEGSNDVAPPPTPDEITRAKEGQKRCAPVILYTDEGRIVQPARGCRKSGNGGK